MDSHPARRTLPVLVLTPLILGALTGCGHSDTASSPATPPASPTTPASPGSPSPTLSPSSPSSTPSPTPSNLPFRAEIGPVNRQMLRYSWKSGCPVPLKDLRVITMPYWGFDKQTHADGKLVVNAKVASSIADTFKQIYAKRYPIRKMVLVDEYKGSDFDSIEADNTSAFNCRAATGSSNWSRHAYGMAVDINPCENPYVDTAGTIYHKKCAKYYKNRSSKDPGVITAGDAVVRAFATMDWKWGGAWSGTKDFQHFSDSR